MYRNNCTSKFAKFAQIILASNSIITLSYIAEYFVVEDNFFSLTIRFTNKHILSNHSFLEDKSNISVKILKTLSTIHAANARRHADGYSSDRRKVNPP